MHILSALCMAFFRKINQENFLFEKNQSKYRLPSNGIVVIFFKIYRYRYRRYV